MSDTPLPKATAVDDTAAEAAPSLDDFNSQPQISRRLCHKAGNQNDELTKAERLLFLSRRDLVGVACAHPTSLTEAQRDYLLGRPPPDILARDIKLLFGVETRAEVMRDYWSPDRTDNLSYPQAYCIACQWWIPGSMLFRMWMSSPEDTQTSAAIYAVTNRMPAEDRPFELAVKKRFTTAPYEESPETFHGTMEEARQLCAKRQEEHDCEAARLSHRLDAQFRNEIKEMTDEDALAMKELRERMRVECEQDADEDAMEAEKKEEERKREKHAESERKKRKRDKRREKEARKAARRGGVHHEVGNDDGESEEQEEDNNDGP